METTREKTHIIDTEKEERDRERQEVVNNNTYYTQGRRDKRVWIAVAIAVLVLLLAFLMWNRNNTRTSPSQVQINAPQTADDNQTRSAEDIRTRLRDVNVRLKENGNFEEAAQSVAKIREDFKVSSQNTGDKTGSSWQGVDDQLNTIEMQLKEKSIDAGGAIDKLIEGLKNFRIDINTPATQ